MNRKAHAKINLSLDVRGKRPDGYHLVDMIMQTVSLCDDIIMEPDESGKISLTVTDERGNAMGYMGTDGRNLAAKPTEPIPTDGRNLMVKAALLMKERHIPGLGIRMKLIKRIPSEAGLGGGSSDAAEVLKGLNELYGLGLTDIELCDAAALIGSDVPFFIYGGTMRATGTGTALKRLRPIKDHGGEAGIPLYTLIVKPWAGNSTPQIYAGYDRLIRSGSCLKRPDVDAQEAAIEGKIVEMAADMFFNNIINVLEYPAAESLSFIKDIEEKLRACGAAAASMTGSGTAVYGLYKDRESMRTAAKILAASGLMAGISGIFETELV